MPSCQEISRPSTFSKQPTAFMRAANAFANGTGTRSTMARSPMSFVAGPAGIYRQPLDAAAMSRAAQAFVGTHDFRSFESRWPQRSSSVRTIYEARVERGRGERQNLISLEFSGNGFLYNMVRALVGTLVEIGRGVKPERWASEVVTAGTRRAAGMTAPAQGLFLVRVDYPSEAPAGD